MNDEPEIARNSALAATTTAVSPETARAEVRWLCRVLYGLGCSGEVVAVFAGTSEFNRPYGIFTGNGTRPDQSIYLLALRFISGIILRQCSKETAIAEQVKHRWSSVATGQFCRFGSYERHYYRTG